MAASFGWAGRRLAANAALAALPRRQLTPQYHCWYRLLSFSPPGSTDVTTKPDATKVTDKVTDTKPEITPSVKADLTAKSDTAHVMQAGQVKPILEIPSEEDNFVERFIPISRRSLVRELMQDEFLSTEENKQFEKFATALDSAIVNQYHGNLADLKELFEAVNPDKDTLTSREVQKRERMDSEFWLLQKLSVLMERANFHELPESVVNKALEEHEAGEGVLVSVNRSNYDILRFWALGREIPKDQPWYKTLPLSFFYRATKRKAPPPQKYYKRVVVAVRPKGHDKLSLKMFKEVPAGVLEQLLPDGKIRMSKFDQGLIATTVGVGSLTLLVKAVSVLADVQLKWTMIIASVTGLAALRFWNSYKNRRVKYLMQLSRTLYYKNVANNRGLLVLLVDRAQDESFKEALLMYTFLLNQRKSSSLDETWSDKAILGGVRTSILERNIERWVKSKTASDIEFDSSSASELLKAFSILQVDEEDNNSVAPLGGAILSLPHQAPSIISRTKDVELEEGYDQVYFEQDEMYDKEEKKQRAHGWS